METEQKYVPLSVVLARFKPALSDSTLKRLVAAGKFPAPIKFSDGNGSPRYWLASEIDEYEQTLLDERERRLAEQQEYQRLKDLKAASSTTTR